MATFDEFERKLQEARSVQYVVRQNAAQMGRLIVPHLRDLDRSTLEAMKRELRDFNIQTLRWMR